MTDIQAGSILAVIQVSVMLGAMRSFYGCWPWEYNKTWYARRGWDAEMRRRLIDVALAAEAWLKALPPEPAPAPTILNNVIDLGLDATTTDSFERD